MKLLIIAFITDTFRPPHYSTFWMWRNDKGIFIICLFMEFAFPIPRRVLFIFFCWILFLAVLYTWEPTSHLFNHPSPPLLTHILLYWKHIHLMTTGGGGMGRRETEVLLANSLQHCDVMKFILLFTILPGIQPRIYSCLYLAWPFSRHYCTTESRQLCP